MDICWHFAPGIEYTIGRVPMASCDYSIRQYSYDDCSGDFRLKHFALAPEDLTYKVSKLYFLLMQFVRTYLSQFIHLLQMFHAQYGTFNTHYEVNALLGLLLVSSILLCVFFVFICLLSFIFNLLDCVLIVKIENIVKHDTTFLLKFEMFLVCETHGVSDTLDCAGFFCTRFLFCGSTTCIEYKSSQW